MTNLQIKKFANDTYTRIASCVEQKSDCERAMRTALKATQKDRPGRATWCKLMVIDTILTAATNGYTLASVWSQMDCLAQVMGMGATYKDRIRTEFENESMTMAGIEAVLYKVREAKNLAWDIR